MQITQKQTLTLKTKLQPVIPAEWNKDFEGESHAGNNALNLEAQE